MDFYLNEIWSSLIVEMEACTAAVGKATLFCPAFWTPQWKHSRPNVVVGVSYFYKDWFENMLHETNSEVTIYCCMTSDGTSPSLLKEDTL